MASPSDDPRFLFFSFVFARGRFREAWCREAPVEVRPLIVLCIDGAICLRVLRDKGHGGGAIVECILGAGVRMLRR